ncbi:hypothetical protein AAVH_11470 [Aphelenchoides avenae]|nr:hypothetical protein AAVH_11470 [Aphelenchus avenae]
MKDKWAAITTAVVVGYTAFFLNYVNVSVTEVATSAATTGWTHNISSLVMWQSLFAFLTSVICSLSYALFNWQSQFRIVLMTKLTSLVAIFTTLFCAIAAVEHYGSSSEILLLWMYYGAFGVACGLPLCFGVPLLFGVTRKEAYKDLETLLGFMAVAMLLGNICGFLAITSLSFFQVLLFLIACAIPAPLLAFVLQAHLEAYAEIARYSSVRMGPSLKVGLRTYLREVNIDARVTYWNRDFVRQVLISSALFSLVDLPRTIWVPVFNELFKKVAGDPTDAGIYCIIGTAIAICCCTISVLYNYFTRYIGTPRRQTDLKLRKSKFSLYAVFAFIFLLVLFLSGFNDYRTTEFAGLGVVGYFAAHALCMESLMEFLPDLFGSRTFSTGWAFTVSAWQGTACLTRMILNFGNVVELIVQSNEASIANFLISALSQAAVVVLVWRIPDPRSNAAESEARKDDLDSVQTTTNMGEITLEAACQTDGSFVQFERHEPSKGGHRLPVCH